MPVYYIIQYILAYTLLTQETADFIQPLTTKPIIMNDDCPRKIKSEYAYNFASVQELSVKQQDTTVEIQKLCCRYKIIQVNFNNL